MVIKMIKSTPKDLKNFGIIMGAAVSLIFGIFLPLLLDRSLPLWPFISSTLLISLAFCMPGILKPFYHIWMLAGQILGLMNFYIIMMLMYFLIFTPIAILFKLLGKDAMKKKYDKDLVSYRDECYPKSENHMEHPY